MSHKPDALKLQNIPIAIQMRSNHLVLCWNQKYVEYEDVCRYL